MARFGTPLLLQLHPPDTLGAFHSPVPLTLPHRGCYARCPMPSFILRQLDPEFWAKVQAKAAAEGTTVKAVILRLLAAWLAAVIVLSITACGYHNPTAPTPPALPQPGPPSRHALPPQPRRRCRRGHRRHHPARPRCVELGAARSDRHRHRLGRQRERGEWRHGGGGGRRAGRLRPPARRPRA